MVSTAHTRAGSSGAALLLLICRDVSRSSSGSRWVPAAHSLERGGLLNRS